MSTDLLDFPEIEAPPPAAAAPVVAPASTAVAMVAPSIKDTVLAQFKDAEAGMLVLAEKYRAVVFDVKTTKGMAEAKAARADLRDNGRLALTRAETRVKADVNSLKKVMGDEVDRLVAIVQPVEDAIDAQIKAEEKRKADEKAERDRIEAERVAKHRERLAKIPAYLTHCQQPGMTAERIAKGIELLAAATFGADWQEFAVLAADAQCKTLEAMRALHTAAVEREAEAERVEAERVEREAEQARQAAENARVAAELAERQRAMDAEAEQQRARVAAQQAELDRQAAELAALRATYATPPAAPVAPAVPAAPAAMIPVAEVVEKPAADLVAGHESTHGAVVDLLGDAITEPAAQAVDPVVSALTQALAMLDELICAHAPKRAAVALFARVSALRDLGGLPRSTPTAN